MKKSLKRVLRGRLFVGSGVEDIVDNNLNTELDEYGQYKVDYGGAVQDIEKVLLNSDDSVDEGAMAAALFSDMPGVSYDKVLGYHTGLYVGHVKVNGYRDRASSGGMASWVASKMMENGDIDGLIHVKKSTTPGVLFEYGISRTIDEINSGTKSRYYPVELSKALDEVKNRPGRYAVVGIPEIITELRLLASVDKVVGERIKYYFGLVCGHQKTTRYAEAIAWEYGIKPGDLEDIDFRVKKDIGPAGAYDMKITGKVDGTSRTFIVRNTEPFVSSWAHGFFKARFSDYTDNAFNELADVTFGDAWLEEYESDSQGNNIVITRNQEIKDLILHGARDSQLHIDEVESSVIARSQEGLIRHTRHELPYRLYKERRKTGWAPRKRVRASNSLDAHRKKVQDTRQDIAEKSHIYYRKALDLGDFNYFKNKMLPYVNKYNQLYGQPAINREKIKKVSADGAILTLTGYFNYGNVIQRYALQKFLKNHGLNFVSYVDSLSSPRDMYRISMMTKLKTPLRAIKRFFNYQKPYWYTPTLGEIHPEAKNWENIINFVNDNIWIKPFDPKDNYKTYITGSDQVWRDWWQDREKLGYYYMNFLKGRKAKRIAYAASFGNDKIEDIMDPVDTDYIRPYIEQFDKISVREKSGIDVIESTWGVGGVTAVVDPTLLLTSEDYSELIDESQVKYQRIQPIFTYILGESDDTRGFVRRVQDHRRQAVTAMRAHGENDGALPPVESWLKGFRDAELVVTNSFHGMMFSIINNTDFIIIGRKVGGISRIRDFLETYGIEDRFIDESDLAEFDLNQIGKIDWDAINSKLDRMRVQGREWLLGAIRDDV